MNPPFVILVRKFSIGLAFNGSKEIVKRWSGKSNCHSERSEDSLIISSGRAPAKSEMFRLAQHDKEAVDAFNPLTLQRSPWNCFGGF